MFKSIKRFLSRFKLWRHGISANELRQLVEHQKLLESLSKSRTESYYEAINSNHV